MDESLDSALREAVLERFSGAELEVVVEGNRALIQIVSEEFAAMSRVDRQRSVYACIEAFITDGRVHAVTIRANPPA